MKKIIFFHLFICLTLFAQQEITTTAVIDKFWQPFENLVNELDFVTKEELRSFSESIKKTKSMICKAIDSVSIDPDDLQKALDGDEDTIKLISSKISNSSVLFLINPSIDLLDKIDNDLKNVIEVCARCVIDLVYELTWKEKQRELDETLKEIIKGRSLDSRQFQEAFCRIMMDRKFVADLFSERPQFTATQIKKPDNVWQVTTQSISPDKDPDKFTDNIVWNAFIRWNVNESRANWSLIKKAQELAKEDAFYDYLNAYFYFFEGKDDEALKSLLNGNKKKTCQLYTIELIEKLSQCYESPMRYFVSCNQIRNPYVMWFSNLANYISGKFDETSQKMELWYRCYDPDNPARRITSKEIESVVDIIRKRLDNQGFKELYINLQDEDIFMIQITGIEPEKWGEYEGLIERRGKLELKEVAEVKIHEEAKKSTDNWKELSKVPEGYQPLKNIERGEGADLYRDFEYILVKQDPVITANDIRSANTSPQMSSPGRYEVGFRLKDEGAKRFKEVTRRLSELTPRGQIAIILDGAMISRPTVQSQIEDEGQITGNYTQIQAEELANILNTGSLPLALEKVDLLQAALLAFDRLIESSVLIDEFTSCLRSKCLLLEKLAQVYIKDDDRYFKIQRSILDIDETLLACGFCMSYDDQFETFAAACFFDDKDLKAFWQKKKEEHLDRELVLKAKEKFQRLLEEVEKKEIKDEELKQAVEKSQNKELKEALKIVNSVLEREHDNLHAHIIKRKVLGQLIK